MEITIDYEAAWRNSFLNGSNNDALPKHGRDYVASSTKLKDANNFICRTVTLDTVMGVLNRLIGDQRKLYQARATADYFFRDLESAVSFVDKPNVLCHEVVYLRNMNGNTDQNAFCGMIKTDDPLLTADYASELWGVLAMDLPELLHFIVTGDDAGKVIECDPLTIVARFDVIEKFKLTGLELSETLTALQTRFSEYSDATLNSLKPLNLYCAALYYKLTQLQARFDLSAGLSKNSLLTGISKKGITRKDFMKRFTTGGNKLIYGNPYIRKERIKGQGEVTSCLTKASGKLVINVAISRSKGEEIATLIDCAGVSSFYLGKKGLAYLAGLRV